MYACLNGATAMPYTLEQDITAASGAGFPALELWGDKLGRFLEGRSAADLASLLQTNHLRPAAIDFLHLDLANAEPMAGARQSLARMGEVARAIGCDTLLLVISGERAQLSKAETLNYVAKLMLPLCDAASRYGLRLSLEPLGGYRIVPGPLEALEIIRTSKVPNLGVTWDFFHYYKSGVPLADIRRIPADRLYIVHANDAPAKDLAGLQDSDRVWPGEGVMPLDDYFEALRELHYAGPVSVEVFNRQYWELDPATLAQEAFESLQPYLP